MSLELSLECPRGKGYWAARQGQKLSRVNFYPAANRCLTWPSGQLSDTPDSRYGLLGVSMWRDFGVISRTLACELEVRYPPIPKVRVSLTEFFRAAPPRGRQLYFTCPGAPDPLFKASKAPCLTLRVATPSGAPRQAPHESQPYLLRYQKSERKTKGQQQKGKTVSALFRTFFTLFHTLFHNFQNFSQDIS